MGTPGCILHGSAHPVIKCFTGGHFYYLLVWAVIASS